MASLNMRPKILKAVLEGLIDELLHTLGSQNHNVSHKLKVGY